MYRSDGMHGFVQMVVWLVLCLCLYECDTTSESLHWYTSTRQEYQISSLEREKVVIIFNVNESLPVFLYLPHSQRSQSFSLSFCHDKLTHLRTYNHQISWLCNVSGPMVRHTSNCHGLSISTHPSPVKSSFSFKNKMFTDTLFLKEKELFTGEGCVEMDNPWQCRTIGPLLSQRFPLASAKALPRGGGWGLHFKSFVQLTSFLDVTWHHDLNPWPLMMSWHHTTGWGFVWVTHVKILVIE